MKKLLIIPALAVAMAAATPLFASENDTPKIDVPRTQWLSVSEIAEKFEAMGYQIHEIEVEDGVYEIEAVDKNGMRVEAYVHPATGDVLEEKADD